MTQPERGPVSDGAPASDRDLPPGLGRLPDEDQPAERGPLPGGALLPDKDLGPLIDDCVHCGFCLPTCPTYLLWGEEMDSPRGRIHLMRQHADGAPLSGAMVEHFDRCLGCMACVTACPSGVRYDELIEATRAGVERDHPRGRKERALREAIFAVFPYRRRLRALRLPLRAYQRSGLPRLVRRSGLLERLSPTLAAMERLAPPSGRAAPLPERIAARGTRRARVAMLTGCVQGEFFPQVNAATARVLAAEGCEVLVPRAQGCCGALSLHTGREPEARRFARATMAAFESADVVVVNSAGCGSAMKDYAALFGADPDWAERAAALTGKTRDLAEFLVELGPRATRRPLPITVAYHDACHLAHAQGVRAQPRELLAGIPELELKEVAEPEICCGSAGVYNLLQPAAAKELGERKAAGVRATGAEVLVAANPGCTLQIATALGGGAGEPGGGMRIAHTAEVLDASLRGIGREAFLG